MNIVKNYQRKFSELDEHTHTSDEYILGNWKISSYF